MASLQAVFVDLDDTFLAPDKSIPTLNVRLMDELAERGIELVPCTGRHVGGVPQAMLAHPCVRHVVASNGGIVHDLERHEDICVVAIAHERVLRVYERLRELPIIFDVFADGKAYSELARRPLFDQIDVPEGLRTYLKQGRTFVRGAVPEWLGGVGPVTKLSIFFLDEDGARAVHEAIVADPALHYAPTSAATYEATDVGATKGIALAWLAARCGWPIEGVVAFGDNHNDVSMIEAAGDGVVMANGEERVKALADHIAPDAATGGVARYLHEFWL